MTQEQIKEYIKCYKDPIYYLNNYGYVFDLEKRLIDRLTLYDFQEPVIRDYMKYTNNIILKSRQQGLSVVTAGYVAWLLLFGKDERILIVANDYKGATRFVDSVKIFLDRAPEWMVPEERVVDNQKELKFSNGCTLKAVASSPQAGRGESLTLLILDETAFIEHANDIWMGAGVALSVTGGKCIMISTPYGTGNLYHRTWVAANKAKSDLEDSDKNIERNPNDFNPIMVHWANHPVLSKGLEWRKDEFGVERPWSSWYENERKRLEYDSVKIAQELDLSFEGSRNLVIDNPILERFRVKLKNSKRKVIKWFDNQNPKDKFVDYETAFRIWHLPEKNLKYIVAADVARGDGSDFSTIQVLDALNLRQVAEYSAKISPDQFATVIRDISIAYNMAYIAVECNSFGLVTSLKIKNDLKYPSDKIFHSKSAVQLFNRDWRMEVAKDEDIPGWQTTTKTRPVLIAALQKYMREGEIEINSERLLDEFQTFVYTSTGKGSNDVKPQHAPGYHDDLIFAFGIALVMRDSEFHNIYWSAENINAMMAGIQVQTSNFEFEKIQIPAIMESNKKKGQNLEDGDDLSWLFAPIKG